MEVIISPVYEKDDKLDCSDHRSITLNNVTYKVLSQILVRCLFRLYNSWTNTKAWFQINLFGLSELRCCSTWHLKELFTNEHRNEKHDSHNSRAAVWLRRQHGRYCTQLWDLSRNVHQTQNWREAHWARDGSGKIKYMRGPKDDNLCLSSSGRR